MLNMITINAMRRLRDEYLFIQNNPDPNIGVTIELPDESNIFQWRISIIGPRDTPYRYGVFILFINFPREYPNSKPEVFFRTPIYHVNVNPIKSNILGAEPLGHVCISILNMWKPEYKITDVLTSIFALFYMTNPDSPYGLERADELRSNKALHEEKIKYFTKKYADPRNAVINKEYFESWDFTYNN